MSRKSSQFIKHTVFALRFIQLIFALITIGIYGTDIRNDLQQQKSHWSSKWGFALILGILATCTAIIHIFQHLFKFLLDRDVSPSRYSRLDWIAFAWQTVLCILWLTLFGMFAKIYVPVSISDAGSDSELGDASKIKRMKAAVWIDLVNWIIWTLATILSFPLELDTDSDSDRFMYTAPSSTNTTTTRAARDTDTEMGGWNMNLDFSSLRRLPSTTAAAAAAIPTTRRDIRAWSRTFYSTATSTTTSTSTSSNGSTSYYASSDIPRTGRFPLTIPSYLTQPTPTHVPASPSSPRPASANSHTSSIILAAQFYPEDSTESLALPRPSPTYNLSNAGTRTHTRTTRRASEPVSEPQPAALTPGMIMLGRILEAGRDGQDPTCGICREEVELRDHVRLLRCGHWYHAHCVRQWVEQSATCPICRESIAVEY